MTAQPTLDIRSSVLPPHLQAIGLHHVLVSLNLTLPQLAELFNVPRHVICDLYEGKDVEADVDLLQYKISALVNTPVDVDMTKLKSLWHQPLGQGTFLTELNGADSPEKIHIVVANMLKEYAPALSYPIRTRAAGMPDKPACRVG